MESGTLDLGVVNAVNAESFGEPGSRTFRLLVDAGQGLLSLWLEKEQLVMLGNAVQELLRRVPGPSGEEPRGGATNAFIGELEVRVGALALGYDTGRTAFSLEASEFVSPFTFEGISIFMARTDLERIADQITDIVAAGRPRCPLCGTPLTGEAHFCPPSNGHARVSAE